MDERLRRLERLAYSGADPALLKQYFHLLKALHGAIGNDEFLRLRDYASGLIPQEIKESYYGAETAKNDTALSDIVKFAREVSKYVWHTLRYDYFSNQTFSAPTSGDINQYIWMLVEFDESRFAGEDIVALTGVYLVNTTRVYIASSTPSFQVSGLYPNIIDVLDHENYTDTSEAWYDSAAQMDYISREHLSHAINYYPIVGEVFECDNEEPLWDCLREEFLANHVL